MTIQNEHLDVFAERIARVLLNFGATKQEAREQAEELGDYFIECPSVSGSFDYTRFVHRTMASYADAKSMDTEHAPAAFGMAVSIEEVQHIANQRIGRDLTPDEIRQVKKGFDAAAEIAFSDVWLGNAIVDIV